MTIEEALEYALSQGEIGVQVAAYSDGELVVDACAGSMEYGADDEPVDRSTVFPIFSVTKAVTATAVHIQAERGFLDYDAPLATYWPEYGTKGKETITIRHVLSHRAGVPQMPLEATPEQMADWDWMIERLADVKPYSAPGTRNTYLSYTFGWLLGEVVRRTDPTHRAFTEFVQEEICEPLGVEAFWMGIPPEVEPRVAKLRRTEHWPSPEPGTLYNDAVPPNLLFNPDNYNLPVFHQAVIPAAGAIADARSVARIFSLLANRGEVGGVRLLSEERVLACLEPRPDTLGWDEVYERPGNAVGVGGYYLHADQQRIISPGPSDRRVLCHPGAGGSIGWADVDARVSIAICHNRMFVEPPEPPLGPLGDAAYEAAVGARA